MEKALANSTKSIEEEDKKVVGDIQVQEKMEELEEKRVEREIERERAREIAQEAELKLIEGKSASQTAPNQAI